MSRRDTYRLRLRGLKSWDEYLLRHSGLPGPRGNLELAQAVADEGSPDLFRRYVRASPEQAPSNTPGEFLVFCGVLGFGRLLAEGRQDSLVRLRESAEDPRWRVREAVAMALQRYGDQGMDPLLAAVTPWLKGTPLERRAVAAGLCEPRLLREPKTARKVLEILDSLMRSLVKEKDRRTDGFRALRQALGYCWSVAAAADPERGLARMERWMGSADPDVRWIMKENLTKARLSRRYPEWVRRWSTRLEESPGRARGESRSPRARR